ncbi:MAG: tripartite tricarboxylate transporter TctB family protein [Firmicutes bacterium]|nr:tripartite tricarboxylate transporter TctB family protein [Bacillota bacterium]
MLQFIIYASIIGLLVSDVKQREENKTWIIASIFFPIVILVYIFVRKPKSETLKSKEGFTTENIIISLVIILMLLVMYYSLFIDPIHTGEEYDIISQSYLIGVTLFFISLIIGLVKQDFAIVAVGIFIMLLGVILYLTLPISDSLESKKNISVNYKDGIFKVETKNDLKEYTIDDLLKRENKHIALLRRDKVEFNKKTLKYYKNNQFRPFSGYAVKVNDKDKVVFYEKYSNGRILNSHELIKKGYIDIDYGYVGFGKDTNKFYPEITKKIVYQKIDGLDTYEISSYNTAKELKYKFKMDGDNNLISSYVKNHFYETKKELEIVPFKGKLNVKVKELDTSGHGYREPYRFTITDGIKKEYHENGVLKYSKIYKDGRAQGTEIFYKSGKLREYEDVLDIKGHTADFIGYLEVDVTTKNLYEIQTKVYVDGYDHTYGSHFDYAHYEGNILRIKKFGDKKISGKIKIVDEGIHFYIKEKSFDYEIYDIAGQKPKKRTINYEGKKFNEYYYENSNLTFKFILNQEKKIKEAYIDYGDMKFFVELKNGDYIVKGSYDKKYHPQKHTYIYDFKYD